MKSKLFLLAVLMAAANFGLAQDQFIEVRVSTEITLQASKIIYQTPISENENSLFGDMNFDDYDDYDEYEDVVDVADISDPIKEIEKVIKKNGYIYTVNQDGGFNIELADTKELETLKNLLENIDGANGKVSDVVFESKEKYYDLIFTDLMRKAKMEATAISKLTNQTLGAVLQVRDPEAQGFGMNDYKDMMNMKNLMGTMFGMGDAETEEKYEREMIFRFAVE